MPQIRDQPTFHGVVKLNQTQEGEDKAVFVVKSTSDLDDMVKEVQTTTAPLCHIFLAWDIVVPEYPEGKSPSTGFVCI
jgi:hypothetical protein